jgi:DNA-binding protein YbaB
MNAANNHMGLEIDPSPVKPPDKTSILVDTMMAASQEILKQTQLSHAQIPDPQNCETKNV